MANHKAGELLSTSNNDNKNGRALGNDMTNTLDRQSSLISNAEAGEKEIKVIKSHDMPFGKEENKNECKPANSSRISMKGTVSNSHNSKAVKVNNSNCIESVQQSKDMFNQTQSVIGPNKPSA